MHDSPTSPGDVLFVSTKRELRFTAPLEAIIAWTPGEVKSALTRVETAVASGAYAAGFIAYEAAPAFDAAFRAHDPEPGLPVLWFGLFDDMVQSSITEHGSGGFTLGQWEAALQHDGYLDAVRRIRSYIAAGDVYQVNYTFPLTAVFDGNPLAWFHHLHRVQMGEHSAYVDLGRHKIISASPELFFTLDGEHLEARPMKGTRPRGLRQAEDIRIAEALRSNEKDQAENVMIVDLLRNDMGRVSIPGGVEVTRLFEVERYETVWQMTSSITSRTKASVPDILGALFPCGSVTGAPKIRAMEIIRELEPHPRGVYCGAMGWWGPGRRASFNVAIRTAVVDTQSGVARYHTGGGVTWDSTPEGEYEECLAKSALLATDRPAFELLESLLHEPVNGYFLLDEHLDRLRDSAIYFGFAADMPSIRAALLAAAPGFGDAPVKVRLLLARNSLFRIEHAPAPAPVPVRLGLAREPIMETDVFLHHKTTHRVVYERAKACMPDCDDVLLWNRRGELTETTTANIALEIDGEWLTPPISSGLLAGVMRGHLIETGKLHEAILTRDDLHRASSLALLNSVRRWAPAMQDGE